MVTMELLLLILGALLGTGVMNAQECSRESLRQCRADIITSMETQNSNSDKLQLQEQCKSLREDMDCVVEQTAMCLREDEQDSNSDIIWKTWRYLGSFCDKFGNWWANACFQREDLKRCETQLPSNSRSLDNVACRGYVNFRACVTSIVDSKCSSEDRSLLVTYLVDRGQEKAWRCPKNPQVFLTRYDSAPLAADSRQTSERYPMMMADSSDADEACVNRLMPEMMECAKKMQPEMNEVQNENNMDVKNRKMCCAIVHLINCIRGVIKDGCGEQAARRGDEAAAKVLPGGGREQFCKGQDADMCSGAIVGSVSIASLIVTLMFAIFVGRF